MSIKTKRLIDLKLSSRNKSTGACIKWHSKEIEATMDINVGVDELGYGILFYYGNHLKGNRAYKTVALNPKRRSADVKIKAIASTHTLRLDGWSIAFCQPAKFDKTVAALRSAGFFKKSDTFSGSARRTPIPKKLPLKKKNP